MKKFIFIVSLIFLLTLGFNVYADSVGQRKDFYIDSSYDLYNREKVGAVLVKLDSNLYFYVDQSWWNSVSQNKAYQGLSELGQEFEENIYPTLTSVFGPEWNPGIDKDSVITILIHPMKESAGGYFRSNDEYLKIQVPDSNEREMLYLNAEHICSPLAKSFLAHEFVHLITFNQKENNYNITESTWLNELRAEYAPTLMGYDDDFEESNLKKRIETFITNPSDRLTDWMGDKRDYGTVNLFGQYLVDYYGREILTDSLLSPKIGIESLNYALEKNGFKEDFSQIFLNWTIAVLVNDCSYGNKYCYRNPNLKNFHVSAKINFLPLTGESTLTLAELTKNYSGNWYKIIGGGGILKFVFNSGPQGVFQVPYITKGLAGNYNINFLDLDENGRGEARIENFGEETTALFLIPSLQEPENNGSVLYYTFSWSLALEKPKENPEVIQGLLARIAEIKEEIARLQARIDTILAERDLKSPDIQIFCRRINNNLYFGLTQNSDVRCLQQFLKNQGFDVYPEGLITGNFLSLTKKAVVRFQEKYSEDILNPWGLKKGTGFVGSATLSKINQLLSLEL